MSSNNFLAQVELKSREGSLAIALQVLRPIYSQDDHSDYEKLSRSQFNGNSSNSLLGGLMR